MLFNFGPKVAYFLKDFSIYLLLVIIAFLLLCLILYKLYKADFSNRKKKVLVAVAFTVFTIIFVFSAFEAYFRYIYDEPDGLGFLKVSKKWTERHVIYNSYFFRDRDFDPVKKEGITRIGVLGDSITFGGGIENVPDRFSNILEEKLKEAGHNVEVYNLGKPGYDTEDEVAEFEKVRHLNFDLIIWEYFLNDIQPRVKSTGTRVIETNRDLPGYFTFFTSKSHFLDFLYWKISPRHQRTYSELRAADIAQYSNKTVLENHQKDIGEFINSFEETNTEIFVVIFPLLSFLGPDYPAKDIHQLMTSHFNQNGVETIDLLDDLKDKNPKELMASRFDAHPNEYVHKLAADRLFEAISRQLK